MESDCIEVSNLINKTFDSTFHRTLTTTTSSTTTTTHSPIPPPQPSNNDDEVPDITIRQIEHYFKKLGDKIKDQIKEQIERI